MNDYGTYKKAIKRTIEQDGIEWNISYAPSRYITKLEGYLRSGARVAPVDALLSAEQWFV